MVVEDAGAGVDLELSMVVEDTSEERAEGGVESATFFFVST